MVLDHKIPCLRYFEALCAIPHGSGNEAQIAAYLMEFARQHGLWAIQEDCGNVIIKKPASTGYETAPAVLLQAHMDMVCEKTSETIHDFTKDPLELYIEDGWLKARGTTLGADDGSGVATILALLDDPALKHPRLECLFTVEEETGMHGARVLDGSLLEARRMIGLDAAGENVVVTSMAGGMRARLTLPMGQKYEANGEHLSIQISGLQGGHSGVFIDAGRGNAIKLLGRALDALIESGISIRLVSISGGSKDNAIARDARAEFYCGEPEKAVERLKTLEENIRHELRYTDPGVALDIQRRTGGEAAAYAANTTQQLVDLLLLLPHGVAGMNHATEHLVQVSDNVGTLRLENDCAVCEVSLRSAGESEMDALARRIERTAALCGAACSFASRYPGKEYAPVSPFRERYAAEMKRIWNCEPQLLAVHAGGEGGYFAQKLPGLEMVCIGPFIEDVHCPTERMNIASFVKCTSFVASLLETLKD